jgi:hypothetical protein
VARPDWRVVVAGLFVVTAAAAGCSSGSDDDSASGRQDEVARRGAEVMPFDLEATTHRFEPTDTGLVQTVVADDPDDAEQVELIQQHLTDEAARFETGDYRDPARIHGDEMPGLAELQAHPDAITITYADLPDGARLTFTTDDPALVDALHRWGEAQTTDHGSHAEQP